MAMREYLIQGQEYRLEELKERKQSSWRRIDETSDGVDEYDALERLVQRYAKLNPNSENDNYFEVRVRATGRSGSAPWFPEQAQENSYNKGLLSRFWIRFALTETEEELHMYGEQFRQFMNDYSFREASLERMRDHYAKRLQAIRSGQVKPEAYALRGGQEKQEAYALRGAQGSPDRILADYCEQAIVYLRSFGYRVTKTAEGRYEVKSLSCHHLTPFFYREGTVEVRTPLGLVLYWQRVADERGLGGEEGLADLGFVVDGKEQEHEKALRERNIPAYVGHDDVGAAYLCVLKKHEVEANVLLARLGARLVEDYTDPGSFMSSRDALGSNYYHNLNNMLEK